MNEEKITGNKVNDGDFLSVLLALKTNVMNNLHVADIVMIDSIEGTSIECHSINNVGFRYSCTKVANLTLQQDDVCLVIFTDTDFRENLRSIMNMSVSNQEVAKSKHSVAYGVIIGLIYRGGN